MRTPSVSSSCPATPCRCAGAPLCSLPCHLTRSRRHVVPQSILSFRTRGSSADMSISRSLATMTENTPSNGGILPALTPPSSLILAPPPRRAPLPRRQLAAGVFAVWSTVRHRPGTARSHGAEREASRRGGVLLRRAGREGSYRRAGWRLRPPGRLALPAGPRLRQADATGRAIACGARIWTRPPPLSTYHKPTFTHSLSSPHTPLCSSPASLILLFPDSTEDPPATMSAPISELTHRTGRQDSYDSDKDEKKDNDWSESTEQGAVVNGVSVFDDPLLAK